MRLQGGEVRGGGDPCRAGLDVQVSFSSLFEDDTNRCCAP